MLNISVTCQQCNQEVPVSEAKSHPCWQELKPWLDAKDKVNVSVGEDCTLCPPDDQRKIKEGYHVNGLPSCEWCMHTDELAQNYESGEITPLSPEDIGKLASDQNNNECSVPSGICPCGDPDCRGLSWLLGNNEPFDVI